MGETGMGCCRGVCGNWLAIDDPREVCGRLKIVMNRGGSAVVGIVGVGPRLGRRDWKWGIDRKIFESSRRIAFLLELFRILAIDAQSFLFLQDECGDGDSARWLGGTGCTQVLGRIWIVNGGVP